MRKNKKSPRIIIIGAGPCGIGAAWNLYKKNYRNWVVYEKNSYAGGAAASFRDKKGFSWDIGGHVFFPRKNNFNSFLYEVLNGKYLDHKRDAWIRILNTWVPYPFQNNIHYLPKKAFESCRIGLNKRAGHRHKPANFKEWIESNFGAGIAKYFLIPQNRKMWSHPLETLSADWVKNKISSAYLKSISRQEKTDKLKTGWGPNNTFIYPAQGGAGEPFRKAASMLKNKLRLNHTACVLNLNSKTVRFRNGAKDNFDILIYTGNIKDLVNYVRPLDNKLIKKAKRLSCNKLLIVGIGLKRKEPNPKCWVYFPERKYSFFRVTYLSSYSPFNVPYGNTQKYSSLMAEFSFPENASVDKKFFIDKTVMDLISSKIISNSDKALIESIFTLETKNGYPIPTLDRDEILQDITKSLEGFGVFPRGRFGSFKYEDGNMDNCFMQGYDTAEKATIDT